MGWGRYINQKKKGSSPCRPISSTGNVPAEKRAEKPMARKNKHHALDSPSGANSMHLWRLHTVAREGYATSGWHLYV